MNEISISDQQTRSRQEAFDEMASSYDESFTRSRLGIWLRKAVWHRAETCFDGCERILELGCGTGEDAIRLAQLGHSVLATDRSREMIEIAHDKAKQAGCEQSIEFRCMPMEDVARELGRERFDGVFSNFGAINCTPDLRELSDSIASVLQPRASLLWVVMGRLVPWEWAWFLARFEWRKAFRRLGRDGTEWRGMRIRYPSPGTLERYLRPHFPVLRHRALGVVLPPSYASIWLNRRPRVFDALTGLESLAARLDSSAALADHYMLEAHRHSCDSHV